jgi:RNA polymerase sigma-70 factor (ECF subfamily)
VTELQIVNGVKNGDREAMHAMYDLLAGSAMATAQRYLDDIETCRDVLQECFLKAFTRIGDFEYRGDGSLRAWMTRIVANEAINLLKRQSNITFLDMSELNVPDEKPPEITHVPPEVINRMIASLPTGYRIVFNQFVFEHKSHKEIAQELGIKENSSASQLLRAKRLLAKMIHQYQQEQDER